MLLTPDKERCWPHLASEGYKVASSESFEYNCIAFAAEVENEWWWPDTNGEAMWPEAVKREERLDCFVEAYATLGYRVCENGNFEPGCEKIAIYVCDGVPAHASKQLPDGRWKSKLGSWEDIEHATIKALEGSMYGRVALYLKRKL